LLFGRTAVEYTLHFFVQKVGSPHLQHSNHFDSRKARILNCCSFRSFLDRSNECRERVPRYLNPWPGREAQGQVAASGSGRIRSGPSQCSTNAPVGKTTGGQDIPLRCLSVTSARHVVFSCLVCASIGSVSEQRILVEILGRPTGRESCVVISDSRFSSLVPGNFQTRFVFLFLHSEILYVDSRTCFSEKSN
jgi:hypothetical protein